MKNGPNRRKSSSPLQKLHRWGWSAAFAGSLSIAIPAAASSGAAASNAPGSQISINKIAIDAYCSEAQSKAALLADGSVSYKHVADLASKRALVEHPSVYRDSSAWKVKI